MSLEANKENILSQVTQACQSVGREPDQVQVIAVTKYVDLETTEALLATGVRHLGENRVDKFLAKYEVLKDRDVTWHLIGSLQRRKVKDVINQVDYFHALDSLSLAGEIQKRATKAIKCFLQVNISEEASKHGFHKSEVDQALEVLSAYDKIELVGLMTMAPFEADEAELRSIFRQTRELQQDLAARQLDRMPFTELSMGMSGDFPIAIQEGASFVRVGTAFFQ